MLSQKITTTVQMLVLKTARSNNTIRRCGLFESLHWDSGREFNLQSLINFNKYVSDMTEAEENVVRQSLTKMKLKRVSEAGSRRSVRRPEEINRDVRGLKLRQRVSLVLGDEILRDELEGVMKTSENGPKRLNGIRTYQDFLLPTIYPGYYGAGGSATGVVPPINDIRGADTLSYSKAERIWRCKLAAVYRVIDLLGWSDNVFNHISLRVSDEKSHFLVNPFGLLYSEITASSLIKVDSEANIIQYGNTSLGGSKASFVLHSAIHEARKDAKCIIHVHTPPVQAVSSMKCGFLRLSQEAVMVGDVSYHSYYGILMDEAEKESIIHDLGPTNKVMFLRNHGVVCVGETVEEAFFHLYFVVKACETQVRSVAVGIDNLHIIDEEIADKVKSQADEEKNQSDCKIKWKKGEMIFEALMRMLDSQGYSTGYPYKNPDLYISEKSPKTPEAQIPPTISTLTDKKPLTMYYEIERGGPITRTTTSFGRANTYKNRIKWLNSPAPVLATQYKKEKPEPKKESVETKEPSMKIETVKFDPSIGSQETEFSETTETVEENGVEITRVVKRKVVTITEGQERVLEDSQVVMNGDQAIKAHADDDFVIIHHKDSEPASAVALAVESEDGKVAVAVNGVDEVKVNKDDSQNEDDQKPVIPGTPPSHHSSKSDVAPEESHNNEKGSKSPKKVKKERSFKLGKIKGFSKKK